MEAKYILPITSTPLYDVGNTTHGNTTESFDPYLELELQNNKQLNLQLPAIVYTSLMMIIGTPGNLVVLYVYFFKWRKSTSRMFILFLTGLDFVNCVTTLPIEIFITRYSLMIDMPWLCKISRFATYTMNSSSAAILVAIAVDRYKRICRPHGHQFSARTSKFICIGCILFALTLTWPAFVLYGTRTVKLGKIEGKACLIENKFDTSIYPYIYFVIMMGSTVIIFSTLSVLYYFVGLQVYKHRRMRLKRNAEKRVAKNLVERCSHEKSETLLQDSDSTELKKQQNGGLDRHNSKENIELKTIIDNHEQEVSGVDSLMNNDSVHSRVEILNGSSKVSIERLKKRKERRAKKKLSKRNNTLQDSLTKANEANCLNIRLRVGRSTLMLFLITIAYIISFLPFYTIAIIRQAYKDFVNQLTVVGYMTYHVFLRSYLLSSAINPIIYSFCNAQFRTFCLDILRKRQGRRGVL